jgi:sodium/bile acid cotransporter 7
MPLVGGSPAVGRTAPKRSLLTASDAAAAEPPEARPSWIARSLALASENSFPLGMALAVALAYVSPTFGATGGPLKLELTVGKYGCMAIFFLAGLGLRLSELARAAASFRLNAAVQFAGFVVWPAAIAAAAVMTRGLSLPISPALLDGFVVTACLPTTVNMCVLLTQSAGGNVALALTNAVMSNTLGVVLTPLLLISLLGKSIDVNFAAVCAKLAKTVLLPVALGQLARCSPRVATFAAKRKRLTKGLSELTLLCIIFNTFSDTFLQKSLVLRAADLATFALVMPAMYAATLILGARLLARLRVEPSDAIAVLYCSSQKTLAFGLPLIRLMFAGHPDLAFYTAPIMVLHPLQLFVGSVLRTSLCKTLGERGGKSARQQ